MLSAWTNEKREIDKQMKLAYQNRERTLSINGAMNILYKHDIIRDKIYTPAEYNEEGNLLKAEYINSRTIYSQLIAGQIAVGAKEAVRQIQRELFNQFGPEQARLILFVHDSIDVYCKPELVEKVKEIVIEKMLKACYNVAGFSMLPVSIEGGQEGEPEEKYTYNGIEITKS